MPSGSTCDPLVGRDRASKEAEITPENSTSAFQVARNGHFSRFSPIADSCHLFGRIFESNRELNFGEVARGSHDGHFWLKKAFSKVASELGKLLVGSGGFEPPTSALSVLRSNQLSYDPVRKLILHHQTDSSAVSCPLKEMPSRLPLCASHLRKDFNFT